MFLRMRAFGSRLWSVVARHDLCQNTIHVRAHLHFHIPTLEYIEKAIHKLDVVTNRTTRGAEEPNEPWTARAPCPNPVH